MTSFLESLLVSVSGAGAIVESSWDLLLLVSRIPVAMEILAFNKIL